MPSIFHSRGFLSLFAICAAAAALIACSSQGNSEGKSRPTLTVSIEPQRYILERIAGPQWNVVSLLGKGADPENFDPSISQMRAVMDSRAFFCVGTMPFEETLSGKLRTGNPDIRIFDSSRGISMIRGTHSGQPGGHDHINDPDNDHGHTHDIDPHTWSSVTNARIMAANMLADLSALDPDNADTYRANFRTLDARLDSIGALIAAELEPSRSAAFTIWHPSLSYFARDYGLRQIPLATENKESSADAFRKKIELARGADAKVMIVQPELDSSRSREIARQTGSAITEVNLLDYDFIGQLQQVATSIARHSSPSDK